MLMGKNTTLESVVLELFGFRRLSSERVIWKTCRHTSRYESTCLEQIRYGCGKKVILVSAWTAPSPVYPVYSYTEPSIISNFVLQNDGQHSQSLRVRPRGMCMLTAGTSSEKGLHTLHYLMSDITNITCP